MEKLNKEKVKKIVGICGNVLVWIILVFSLLHITSPSSFLHYLLQWFQDQDCNYKGLKQGRFLSKKMFAFCQNS